jgi:glutamyl/glutaminyl-tRNA synthetase
VKYFEKILKTRLAPTPSGFLHIGNGAAFVATWALARACDGQILLRIDDLDAQRMRPEYVEDMFKTLDWLGLNWDEGPFSTEDFHKNWSQHTRLDSYEKALNALVETGDLYACNCSRKDIRLNSTNGLYPNTCRKNRLNPSLKTQIRDKNTAWRIVVEDKKLVHFKEIGKRGVLPITSGPLSIWSETASRKSGKRVFDEKTPILEDFNVDLSQKMGDFIVRQKNGLPSYQLASLVDDGFFDINFIIRGEDLLASTAAQIFLAEKLNLTDFLNTQFWHHPLATDAQGLKLSKSEGATSLLEIRKNQNSAAIVVQQAAKWLGFDDFKGETALELSNFIKYTEESYFSTNHAE